MYYIGIHQWKTECALIKLNGKSTNLSILTSNQKIRFFFTLHCKALYKWKMKIQLFWGVTKHSDILHISRTARQELNVLLMWSTSAEKKKNLVESWFTLKAKFALAFFHWKPKTSQLVYTHWVTTSLKW